jgi:hypothetical protein
MKRILTLAALLGTVGLASWTGATRPAFAAPICDSVNGTACSPTGARTTCTLSDGSGDSVCSCTAGHVWRCLL